MDGLDKGWIGEHAHQVWRMLTGGIEVLGFYFFGTAEKIDLYPGTFQTVIMMLAKIRSHIFGKFPPEFSMEDQVLDFVLLTIGCETKKYSVVTYKIQNNKVLSWKTSEFGFKPISKLQQYTTTWAFHGEFKIGNKDILKSQFEKYLQEEFKKIGNATGVVSGQLVSEDKKTEKPNFSEIPEGGPKTTTTTTQKKRGKPPSQGGCKISTHDVVLYSMGLESLGAFFVPTTEDSETVGLLQTRGFLVGRAYYTNNFPTYQQILTAVKLDLMISLSSRCALWYEELEAKKDDNQKLSLYNVHTNPHALSNSDLADQTWSFPRRVFFKYHDSDIYLCDYLTPTEDNLDEVIDRAASLLEQQSFTASQIQQPEKYVKGGELTVQIRKNKSETIKNHNVQKDRHQNSGLKVLFIFAAVLVVFAAIGIGCFLYWLGYNRK